MNLELLPDDWFNIFRGWVRTNLALNFAESQRRNLSAGIARAMQETNSCSWESYWDYLSRNPAGELARLARLLTVPETYFFRDVFQMRALQTAILPRLITAKSAERSLSVWSAGCSTGEEPYTIAMLLADLLPDDWRLAIYGTDINAAALEQARQACYDSGSTRELSPEQIKRFFTETDNRDDKLCLVQSLRKRVQFVELNLIAAEYPKPFNRADSFDLILCRNVLIYFADEQAATVVQHLGRALAPTGYLISGQAEPINRLNASLYAEMVGEAIVYRKGLRPAPTIASPVKTTPNTPAALKQADVPRVRALEVALPVARKHPGLHSAALPLYEQALEAANNGRWVQALELCKRAVADHPMDYCGHQLLGLIYEARGEFMLARESLRRALYLKPDALMAHFYLANLYHQLSDAREMRTWGTLARLLQSKAPDEIVEDSAGMTVAYLRSLVEPLVMNRNPNAAVSIP